MSDKQTRCPQCQTVYKVSLTQLTIAQGMVCCPKCDCRFNALIHLVTAPTPINPPAHLSGKFAPSSLKYTHQNVIEIFNRRIENSNLDLVTYLNNLSYFQDSNIPSFPSLNLAASAQELSKKTKKKHGWSYYLIWGSINLLLVCIFIFQILWFNPKVMQKSSTSASVVQYLCSVIRCENFEDDYSFLNIRQLKVTSVKNQHMRFTGLLINYQNSSLTLPRLKLTLKNNKDEKVIILDPEQYLVKNLASIKRIPYDRPFAFDFTVPYTQKAFNEYDLEIIQP